MTNDPRHDLDDAIDRVAARLVAVDDDAGALQAALARLPERVSQPWFLSVPVQATAATALIVMAFLWARPGDRPVMPVAVAPIAATAAPAVIARTVAPASVRPVVRIPEPGPRIPSGAIDRPDHERSLAPVEPLTSLMVSSISPATLEHVTTEVIAPLVLTELPLASDASSPRER